MRRLAPHVEAGLVIAFRVPGLLPVPQGSKRHVGGGRMVERDDLKPWREAVTLLALRACGYARPSIDRPALCVVEFTFPRPAAPKRHTDPHRKDTAPDVDKLARAVFDALTAAAIVRDDARFADLVALKRYGDPGAYIVVSTGELDLPAIVRHARATEPLELDAA